LAGGDKAQGLRRQAPKLVGGGDKISGVLGHGVAAGRGSGTLLSRKREDGAERVDRRNSWPESPDTMPLP